MSIIKGVLKVITGKHPKTGKREKHYYIEREDGSQIHLLNPDQRGRKYSSELKTKKETFSQKDLSNTQLAYRSGYLRSRSDNAKAHKKNKEKRAAARAAKKGGN